MVEVLAKRLLNAILGEKKPKELYIIFVIVKIHEYANEVGEQSIYIKKRHFNYINEKPLNYRFQV